ncbi:MAG: SUMF1/EgtB/PvdO family nonheme iron enzyme, partial [Nitrospira sp.]|nr:SUMF1/EgtB/PvdO family nonheme iron enzyme [Nitrospira sp.]
SGQDCRVLVTSGEEAGQLVEVAHERLFTGWDRLKNWIEKSGEALRLIDYAEEAATRWHERGESPDDLWLSPQGIQDTLQAVTRFGKNPSPVLERFLNPAQELITVLERPEVAHQDRFQIGLTILLFGDDPRPGVGVKDGIPDIEWVDIPGGNVRLEKVDHLITEEGRIRQKKGDYVFTLKPFKIAKYPVTNAQFQAFIEDGGYEPDQEWWKGLAHRDLSSSIWPEPNAPRENVSWFEAVAFCRWLSARTGKSIRLPMEWEWQQAATGGNPANEYPWGKEWDPARCNGSESCLNRTTPVGLYPKGATVQGVMDMVGNVWEWCLNWQNQPEHPEAVRQDDLNIQRVLRGKSWKFLPLWQYPLNRLGATPSEAYSTLGFRLAQDIR